MARSERGKGARRAGQVEGIVTHSGPKVLLASDELLARHPDHSACCRNAGSGIVDAQGVTRGTDAQGVTRGTRGSSWTWLNRFGNEEAVLEGRCTLGDANRCGGSP
jgi:hypothetical protein